MKRTLLFIFLNLIIVCSVYSQSDPIQKAEILIKNSTNHIFFVKVYPVGADFSGYEADSFNDTTFSRKYSLMRSNQSANPYWPVNPADNKKYIVGGKKTIQSNSYSVIDFDDGNYFNDNGNANKVIGGISYGLWKFEFYYTQDAQTEEENVDLIADCYIDYRDMNHGQNQSFTNDIYFNLIRKQNSNNDSLVFNWKSGDTLNIFDSRVNNKIIKSWHKVGLPGNPSIPGSPNLGLFKTLPFKFSDFPINAAQYGALQHVNPEDIGMNIEIDSNGTKIKSNNSLHFKKTNFTIKSGINFAIDDSSDLFLDSSALSIIETSGQKTFLIGNNAGIIGINRSSVNIRNTNFYSTTNNIWNGITLTNSSEDSITNCTFTNSKTALTIISNPSTSFKSRVIKNNTFNVPSGGDHRGIYGENNFSILIQNNIFNMPSSYSSIIFGVYLKNNNTQETENPTTLTENETPISQYSIYIIDNTFNYGTASLLLTNYTSSYLPVFVKNNVFNSASVLGILGRSISGAIKDNRIMNYDIPMGIHLISSSPALYYNTVNTENVSVHTIGSSYPDLEPTIDGINKIWKGGRNKLSSLNSDDFQLVNAGNVQIKLGENKYTVSDTSQNYHIYGRVDSTVMRINARNNCWTPGNNAKIYLRRIYTSEQVLYETGIYNVDCEIESEPISTEVYYLGNGMHDTAYVTSDTTGSFLTAEDLLYNQGKNYKDAGMFIEGISSLKDLINTYPYYEDLPASVYDLYSCYEYLDTTSAQSYRNTLYGNLKIYLEDKIETEEGYDAEFKSNAYNITLMCDANMENYDDAANGYEFIALFHPDPDIRLNASWDYAEIEALMGGGYGGGNKLQVSSEKLQIEELNGLSEIQEINELKRINEIISNDPIMSKMKAVYEKISKERAERNERTEKQIKENSRTNVRSNEVGKENSLKSEQFQKQTEKDKFKNDKARRNIFELKNLNKQELEKRRIEDMFLSAKDVRNTVSEIKRNLNNLLEFKLYQNYPNPFNPTTTISFSISENSFVKLKVFDIIGKEVSTLINDYKQSGVYDIKFDGSNLSSGVYFCRLETVSQNKTFSQSGAGNNFEIKKMILIK